MRKIKKSIKKEIEAVISSLCVVLRSEGNPDFKQFAPISPPEVKAVQTLQEAADACVQYIEEYDLGMGNWVGGQVYHPTKGFIATVSYNGRLWKGDLNDFKKEPEEYPAHLLTEKWGEL